MGPTHRYVEETDCCEAASDAGPPTSPARREGWEYRSEALGAALHFRQLTGQGGEPAEIVETAHKFHGFLGGEPDPQLVKENAQLRKELALASHHLDNLRGAARATSSWSTMRDKLRLIAEVAKAWNLQPELLTFGVRVTQPPTCSPSLAASLVLTYGDLECLTPQAIALRLSVLAI